MKYLLVLAILGGAGCRSTMPGPSSSPGSVSSLARNGGAVAVSNAVAGVEVDAPLPGIGETPDVVPVASAVTVSDPLEPINRAFYHFNDKLYFWVLKPVSRGYAWAMPAPARRGVRNFFSNLATPVRLVSCALQAEFGDAWVELERFGINTTIGVAGFGDPARNWWNLEMRNEDLGQVLGRYGVGPSLYLNWPILGPSCARDTVGTVGGFFLDPINYLVPEWEYNTGIKAYDTVNATSLRPGAYEDFKEAAIDPYVALRDAYYQYRRNLVSNGAEQVAPPPVPRPTEAL